MNAPGDSHSLFQARRSSEAQRKEHSHASDSCSSGRFAAINIALQLKHPNALS
jgi:hypothetical protein